MFESGSWDRSCRTCAGDVEKAPSYAKQPRYCSHWCHLVENGPAYFTLETITPWLKTNRVRVK